MLFVNFVDLSNEKSKFHPFISSRRNDDDGYDGVIDGWLIVWRWKLNFETLLLFTVHSVRNVPAKSHTRKCMFFQTISSTFEPMVGLVCTTSFIRNWYSMVVLPALSNPTITNLCSTRCKEKERTNSIRLKLVNLRCGNIVLIRFVACELDFVLLHYPFSTSTEKKWENSRFKEVSEFIQLLTSIIMRLLCDKRWQQVEWLGFNSMGSTSTSLEWLFWGTAIPNNKLERERRRHNT